MRNFGGILRDFFGGFLSLKFYCPKMHKVVNQIIRLTPTDAQIYARDEPKYGTWFGSLQLCVHT